MALPKIAHWVQAQGWTILHAHTGPMQTLSWFLKRRFRHVALVRTRADARRAQKKMFYQQILKDTALTLFPTRKMREQFLLIYDYPIRKAKTVFPVLPGFDEGASTAGAGANGRSAMIALVGRLDPVKGQSDLIRAMALLSGRFPNAACWMIGQEQNVKTQDLKSLASKLGVALKIHFAGYLKSEELAAAMARCDIGVIASRDSEVISRVCLEWMSLGKPLVATRVGMIPELIQDGRSGVLVEPGCPEELSYGIAKLLRDPTLAHTMGMGAQARYHQRFAPEPALSAHLELYRSLGRQEVAA